MSLSTLISGADCALPANPLSQVLKHTDADRTAQRDRVAGPSSSRLQHLPSTSNTQASERDLSLARQFFDSSSHGIAPSPMQMHIAPHPQAAMHPMNAGPMSPGQQELYQGWLSSERPVQRPLDSSWASEFNGSSSASQAHNFMQTSPGSSNQFYSSTMQNFSQNSYMPSQSFYQPYMGNSYSMNMSSHPSYGVMHDQGKGKGKSREESFEAAFAQYATSASITEVKDDVSDLQEALQDVKLEGEITEPGELKESDFESVWKSLQDSGHPPKAEDLAKWESEFNQLMSAQRNEEDLDYGSMMEKVWEDGLGDYEQPKFSTSLKFDDEGIPLLGDYVFETNNPYLSTENIAKDHLSEAKRLLASNGSLSEAALLLEAAIQQNQLGTGGYEAWILLGETRSMDEREEAGMRALKEGVRRAEEAGATGEGMLSLAISYTNEGYEKGSQTMLMRWLMARFPSYKPPTEASSSLKNSTWDSYERVTDAFLTIARQQHTEGIVDPDVQAGLGVLFYTHSDFTRAKDCFESALSARPKDYLLWNRLGSSLSNGNKPEEALGAYREALNLRPTYTRAIYNVGVACLNIGALQEAVEHFLYALTLQDTTEGEKSEQIWFTLRRTFIAMGRDDLTEKARAGASVEAFRSEGFDF